jgi:hypothetical protein
MGKRRVNNKLGSLARISRARPFSQPYFPHSDYKAARRKDR